MQTKETEKHNPVICNTPGLHFSKQDSEHTVILIDLKISTATQLLQFTLQQKRNANRSTTYQFY